MARLAAAKAFDLRKDTVRNLNQFLHRQLKDTTQVRVVNPDGAHSIAQWKQPVIAIGPIKLVTALDRALNATSVAAFTPPKAIESPSTVSVN